MSLRDLVEACKTEPWMKEFMQRELDYAKKQQQSWQAQSPDTDPVPDGARDQARQEGD